MGSLLRNIAILGAHEYWIQETENMLRIRVDTSFGIQYLDFSCNICAATNCLSPTVST